jgi:uncharacterized protein YjbJ (UPF0337 family)
MNRDILEGEWMQIKGRARRQWGKLTDDDIAEVKGNVEVLTGKIQERYGRSREEAEREIERWLEEEKVGQPSKR